MAATLVTRELDVRTDSDEYSAICEPRPGRSWHGSEDLDSLSARFPESCR
jgi:hypothetical protein